MLEALEDLIVIDHQRGTVDIGHLEQRPEAYMGEAQPGCLFSKIRECLQVGKLSKIYVTDLCRAPVSARGRRDGNRRDMSHAFFNT